jgi:hypothetical protein
MGCEGTEAASGGTDGEGGGRERAGEPGKTGGRLRGKRKKGCERVTRGSHMLKPL